MVWSEETILQLRELWDLGLSTAEIGRRLGVTTNAIVGKAHRLDLPARPSPIQRGSNNGSAPKETPRRAKGGELIGSTLPPLPSTDSSLKTDEPVSDLATIEPATATPEPPTVVIPAVPEPTPPMLPIVTENLAEPVSEPPQAESLPTSTLKPTEPRNTIPAAGHRTIPCQWPIGEPGKKDFRFCDDASIPGKSYCDEHIKLAYVRFQDRREDAA